MRTVLKYLGSKWNNYLAGWKKRQFSSCAEHGKPRIETVWMNYETDNQLSFKDMPEVLP